MKELKRLKAVQDLLNNPEAIELMADFKRQQFAGITIVENQIENEEELARYWLKELESQIFKTP